MNRKPASPSIGRRSRLLEWLFGSPAPVRRAARPLASEVDDYEDEDPGRSALLGNGQPASRHGKSLIPREMFRVSVNLPANLDIGATKTLAVRITNVSGTGAALLYDSAEPLPDGNHWLDLVLPNRQKPMELETIAVHSRPHTGSQGQDQQIVHVKFPSIRRNEQDAIIAYINNIRIYEDKQFSVAAKVMLEVVTGRRRFAKFTGETVEIRPDLMRLMMDDFDAIAGSEVMLTIMAPHFADHLDVDDVKIEKVDIVGPRKAEVEVSLSKPDDKVLLFIRKHYPGVVKSRR